jgi:hypothetical protein
MSTSVKERFALGAFHLRIASLKGKQLRNSECGLGKSKVETEGHFVSWRGSLDKRARGP